MCSGSASEKDEDTHTCAKHSFAQNSLYAGGGQLI